MSEATPRARLLEVRQDQLSTTRIGSRELRSPGQDEILCRVDRFALTANNITYGVAGERIGYWKFFPAEQGWGVIPVWGFADVVESGHAAIPQGERLYGYFPMGTHVVLQPQKVSAERLLDGSAHRAGLPPVYNSYARLSGEPHFDPAMEDERMLLLPLYATSYCLFDFLQDAGWFGAAQVVIVSASSRTALGLAMALDMNPGGGEGEAGPPPAIALTSQENVGWVSGLGLYRQVCSYEQIADIDPSKPTVIVDMSGDGGVLSALHAHLGDNMRYCSNVGITHYGNTAMGPGFIRERSAMFFAPGHIQKRSADWGPGVFQQKSFAFWQQAALRSRAWLRLEYFDGMDGMERAYRQVLAGRAHPSQGLIVRP